jgi:hypothetical protein
MSVVWIYSSKKEKWLIDWNNTFLYKEKVCGKIITFWSSDQPTFPSVEYHPNYQYVDFDDSTYSLFFFDILGRVRSLTLTAEVCTYTYIYMLLNSAAWSQSIFALSSFEKISDVHKSLLSGAKEKRERENLNCPSHHISFVWYWTTFRYKMTEHWTINWPLAKN